MCVCRGHRRPPPRRAQGSYPLRPGQVLIKGRGLVVRTFRCAARVGSRRHRFSVSPLPEAVREDMARRTHTKTPPWVPGLHRGYHRAEGGPQGSAEGSPDGSRDRVRVRGPLQWPGPPSLRPVGALHNTVIPGASELLFSEVGMEPPVRLSARRGSRYAPGVPPGLSPFGTPRSRQRHRLGRHQLGTALVTSIKGAGGGRIDGLDSDYSLAP